MAQPKQSRKEASDSRLDALRELLGKAVMLPSDRLREALDDAVRRGRMTRDDAEELYQSLVAAGRRQVEDVMADLEQLLGRSRSGIARVTGMGGNEFPIADYDELAAGQVTQRLDGLTPAELRRVRDYERRHANRKTVLSAIERKLA
jgi:hypothetical protein